MDTGPDRNLAMDADLFHRGFRIDQTQKAFIDEGQKGGAATRRKPTNKHFSMPLCATAELAAQACSFLTLR
jgi:hypothetical protein